MKKYLFLIASALVACSGPSEQNSDSNKEIRLTIQDSLQIEHLGELVLMDINPSDERILFFDFKTRDFIVSDMEGNKLNTFNKTGDGPDGFGQFPMTPGRFNGSGTFQIMSYSGMFEYDVEGNLVNKTKLEKPLSFMGRSTAEWEFYPVGEDSILSVGIQAWGEHPRNTPEYYEEFQLLNILDLNSTASTRFMNLEDNSIFKNGKGHELPDMIPAMSYEDGRIYIVVGKDKKLHVYDSKPPYALLNSKELDLVNFKQNQGVSFSELNPQAIKVDLEYGRIITLKKYGDHLLLTYVPGFNEADAELFRSEKDNTKQDALYDELKLKYPARLHILNMDLESLVDMELPSNLNNRQFIVRNDQLWFMGEPNPEVEEEFFRVYRVDIE